MCKICIFFLQIHFSNEYKKMILANTSALPGPSSRPAKYMYYKCEKFAICTNTFVILCKDTFCNLYNDNDRTLWNLYKYILQVRSTFPYHAKWKKGRKREKNMSRVIYYQSAFNSTKVKLNILTEMLKISKTGLDL